MKLVSILNPDLICIGENLKSQEEVISLFSEKFYSHYKANIAEQKIKNAINDREKLGSTIFPTGMAIPHGRLENFDDLIIGICIPENPIKVDETDIRIFITILCSQKGSTLYVQTLAAFSKIAMDPVFFDKLVSCRSSKELFELCEDIQIKKDLTVEDIMSTGLVTVTPDTTLKKLADIFYEKNLGYLPVVDEKGILLGEITMKELLKTAIPDYAEKVGNLNFLSSFEPLEYLLANEEKITVKEIMKKSDLYLEKNSTVIEAAFKIGHGNRRHIPVVENGYIIGIVSFTDLLRKVLRR
ncbi:MAG: CBS domain-containing protein [Spirochaetes bacterium]|nr:CBS domain-containing protein [Spirochaetota bacterium]